MKIQTGQYAPDFTLYDTAKNKINLASQKGNAVLLLFFPQAFSSVCTKELCMVRDNLKLYESVQATVFGISVDSVYTLAAFKQQQQFNFTLLSDFNKEVSASYGTLYPLWKLDMKGVARRSAFVIDKEGIVRYAEIMEKDNEIPDFESIRVILEKLSEF